MNSKNGSLKWEFLRIIRSHFSCFLIKTYHNLFGYGISLVIRRSFSLPKQSKNPDPSYKMDLDVLDC